MAVYSVRFIGASLAAGASSSYTVPSGNVAVVRDISAYLNSSSTDDLNGSVQVAGGPHVYFFAGQLPGFNNSLHWEGRVVLNAGDALIMQAASQPWFVIVSGYLLPTT